jgi:cobalt-zinc-cadmium efflux system outer membrane protein
MTRLRPLLVTALALLVSGCATVSKEEAFSDVNHQLEQRTGVKAHWLLGGDEDRAAEAHVRQLLTGELSADGALAVALLRNRRLQARYENIGIAQADLVQAGLLKNPSFSASVGFPNLAGANLETDFSLVQDFLSIFTIPLRRKLAGAELERTKLQVGAELIDVAAQVRGAYFAVVADQQLLEMWRNVVAAEEAATALATKQLEAGNIQSFDLDQQLDQLGGAKLALGRAEISASDDRERLTRLMGLWGKDVSFRLPARLPDLPASVEALDDAEAVAIGQRMDLAAAIQQRDTLAYSLSLVTGTRFLPGLQLGVSTQRGSPEGVRVTGPTLELELPLFDQGQGRVGRLEAEVRLAQDEVSALAVEIRSEVRAARTQFTAARSTVNYYQREVLPLRERLVQAAQLQYNAMQIGLYRLLAVKQRQIEGGRDYVEALRSYWTSRADLERALGGRLPANSRAASGASR